MARDAIVSARVNENLKTEAESILQQPGIPVSVAFTTLYRQLSDKVFLSL